MANQCASSALATGEGQDLRRVCPNVPQSIEELGIPATMLMDIALRYLREQGSGSLMSLRKALKLSFPIVDSIFQQLRQQQLIDVRGTAGTDYSFALTTNARNLAAERSNVCRYAGPAPVPLDQYWQVVRSQRTSLEPTRDQISEALADLVVPNEILHQLGAALTSGRPIFLYGPSGNGKTSVIERLSRLFDDTILVPYCVEVDRHIISVLDPAVHVPLELPPDEQVDQRWVRCHRPCIISGGELVPEMLSLRLDSNSGLYAAPLQMKAANGILAIDDFGRQTMSPRALFNRWILPLDRRVDNLALEYGFMFKVPFEVILVFSTNLHPSDLADEAFIRRVPNKVYLGPIAPEVFDEICERVFTQQGLPCDRELAAYLRELCRQNGATELRACHPGDICEILASLARYERRPFGANSQALARAARLYFMQSAPLHN